MNDIEIADEGGIRVQKDGKFHKVPTPSGFTDYMFRAAVTAFDTAYRTNGKLPTVNEVHKFWSRIPVKTYAALFVTTEFKQALAYRGISWEVDDGLSIEQSMALLSLTDHTDRRSTASKMKDLGVPMSRYQAWLNNPLFMSSYNKRMEDSFQKHVPMALNKLMGNVEAGEQRAIEKYLEIQGRWNPAQMQLEDARKVIEIVVESVISEIKDEELLRRIFQRVQAAKVGYDLTQKQRELEADIG